jgi:hypothetical protein
MLTALLTNPLVISAVIGAITYIWGKVTGDTKDKNAQAVEHALSAIGSVFEQWVLTAPTTTSVQDLKVVLKGLAAVQLGKLGIYTDNPLRKVVDNAVDALVQDTITKWLQLHPSPKSLAASVVEAVGAPHTSALLSREVSGAVKVA